MTTTIAHKNEKVVARSLARHLPLLGVAASLYPNTDLSDIRVIGAQHLVSTTYSLFDTLLGLGLKPENLAVIGKCYSTDPAAYREMKKRGIDVCASSLSFDSHQSFDDQYQKTIEMFVTARVNQFKDTNLRKLIILDDGGDLISAINGLPNKDFPIVGVEQTSAGFHKLKTRKPAFPIINVARSHTKLNYESPFIARSIVEAINNHLNTLSIRPKEVLIIGNGAIGAQIREILKEAYQVSIFDQVTSKSSIKTEDFASSLKRFDLIIGCTGKPVLKPEHYQFLKKNVVLASASSSDREFDAVGLRNRIPLLSNCHTSPFIDGIHLVNCGFPVNFTDDFAAIDSDYLQLTRALLLLAVLQANFGQISEKKGFIDLNISGQNAITAKHLSMMGMEKLAV